MKSRAISAMRDVRHWISCFRLAKSEGGREARNRLIRIAHGQHGYTLTEIARLLGVHYTTVSKVINAEKGYFKT